MNFSKVALLAMILAAFALPAVSEIDLTTGQEAIRYPTTPLPAGHSRGIPVLWDLTHGVYLNYQPSGAYSELTALLTYNGYSVTTTTEGIDTVDLSQYDVLVIAVVSSWHSAYSSSEVAAIVDFVSNGGGLLIMGDNASCHNENINPVSQAFGTTTGTVTINPQDLYFSSFTSHRVFDGISLLYFLAAGALTCTTPSIEAAWTDAGETVISVYEPFGKVLVTGDANFCDNANLGDLSSDNLAFILNVFEYLAKEPVLVENASWGSIKANFR